MKMAGIGISAKMMYSFEMYSRDPVGEACVFSVRAVSRPQLSFSLEERGARPSYVV